MALVLFLDVLPEARPATRTWTGGSITTSYWTDAANWQGGVAPTSGDNLVFPDAAMRSSNTNSFSGGTTFRSIRIIGDHYNLYGNWVRLTDGFVAEAGATMNYVMLDLRVDSDQTFACQSRSSLALTFMGDVEIHDCILTVDTEGMVSMYGVILGTGGLTKTGPGTLQMTGNSRNTYTGTTTVNEGVLELSKAIIGMGATAVPGPLVIGDGVGGADSDVVRLEAWSQIDESSLVRVNRSGLLDLDGNMISLPALTLHGGHVRTGTGPLWLTGPLTNLASSVTAVIGGTLQLNQGGVRRFQIANGTANPDLLISARITALGSILKTGGGTLTLAGANTYQGSTRVEEGTLIIANDKALGSTAVGTVVTNRGHLHIQACDVGNETLSVDSSVTLLATGPASWSGPVEFNHDGRIEVTSGVFDLRGATVFDSLTKRGAGALRFSRAAADPLEGEVTVTAGTLELGLIAGGSFTGTLAIGDDLGGVEADVVRFVAANQLSTTATVVINSSGLLDLNGYSDLVGPLTFNGGRMQTGSGTATLLYGVTANASSSAPARIAGRLLISGPRTFTVASGPFSPDLIVSADIGGNGGLTKRGAGEMSLSGSNSFDGLTTVRAGTLDVDHPSALGTTSNGTVVEDGGTLTLRYGVAVGEEALALSGIGSGSGSLRSVGGDNAWAGSVALDGDTLMQVHLSGDSLELSGPIAGTGDLIKSGVGSLILCGNQANQFAGRVLVNAGALELGKSPGADAVPGELEIGDGSGGAEADVVRLLRNYQIDNQAGVTVAGSGLFDVNGQLETIGSLAGNGRVDLANGSLNVGYNGRDTEFAGVISGVDGRLSKYGPGTLILSGHNTYSGCTTVNYGVLLLEGYQTDSPVQVNSLGTLGGCGQTGPVTNKGTIAPGPTGGTGVLTCYGAELTGDNAVLAVDLDGIEPGEGYDVLNVRGTVGLEGASLQASLGFAPKEGDQFKIISNDDAEPVVGAFAGLPDDSPFTINGLPFRIDYDGNTGNDVVLTVTNIALACAGLIVESGNGNGFLDPDECNLLFVSLTNRSAQPVSDVFVELSTSSPGVWISRDASPFPNLASGQAATNLVPFQFTTLPGFLCGATIELALTVNTLDRGRFTIPLSLPSGSPGSVARYDVNKAGAIPDLGVLDSTLDVAGMTALLAEVRVSCFITHPSVGDLSILLMAPDNTVIPLSMGNGGRGDNYGGSCEDRERTTFCDSAHDSITSGTAPFVGRFRPEAPLSRLRGALANGTWRLRVIDATAGSTGILKCWSLLLYPATCTPGGGSCRLCPDCTITGTVTASDPSYTGRLQLNGIASSCSAPKPCPGSTGDDKVRHCDVYPFANGPTQACVTVSLATDCPLFSAVFTNAFDPADFCENYLADPGRAGAQSYSFNVGPGAAFAVVVSELDPGSSANCGDYTLCVTGGSCVPWLNISRLDPETAQLSWPTFAPDFKLEAASVLEDRLGPFSLHSRVPVVIDGQYSVTETITASNCFYRLHKP